MTFVFLRHGATPGNLEKRYIGRSDESLSPAGIEALKNKTIPRADFVFVSPMKRCIETAGIVYPNVPLAVSEDLRECDFGDFEGKNYEELNKDAAYQKWIDSMGTMPFPGGEDPAAFKKRCVTAFSKILTELPADEGRVTAFVVHGGTIMSIFEAYETRHDYYHWQCRNGCGYVAEWNGEALKVTEAI